MTKLYIIRNSLTGKNSEIKILKSLRFAEKYIELNQYSVCYEVSLGDFTDN